MSFESGSISCRAFMCKQWPDDAVARLAEHAMPEPGECPEPVSGWVTGRHLLDRDITDESVRIGRYLRVTLGEAKREVPRPLLHTEVTREIAAYLAATGSPFMRRDMRMEMVQDARARLTPTMPLGLRGIDAVHVEDTGRTFATCLSDRQCDAFAINMSRTLGFVQTSFLPNVLASYSGVWPANLTAASFSAERPPDDASVDLGAEFLTWLWFLSETTGETPDGGHVLVGVGPVLLGAAEEQVTLRGGVPTVCAEAKAALLAGKRVLRARVLFEQNGEAWIGTLDSSLTVRGLKLPEHEAVLDIRSQFEARMGLLEQYFNKLESLFIGFAKLRASDSWPVTEEAMRDWVSTRRVCNG